MPGLFDIGSLARDVLGEVRKGLDDVFTSKEEKKKAKQAILKIETGVRMRLLDIKEKLIERRADVVVAEAQGESWLQRSWRPITMLVFVALIVLHWLGWAGMELTEEVQLKVYSLIKLGLGGYVFGRSAEKIAPYARDAVQRKRS